MMYTNSSAAPAVTELVRMINPLLEPYLVPSRDERTGSRSPNLLSLYSYKMDPWDHRRATRKHSEFTYTYISVCTHTIYSTILNFQTTMQCNVLHYKLILLYILQIQNKGWEEMAWSSLLTGQSGTFPSGIFRRGEQLPLFAPAWHLFQWLLLLPLLYFFRLWFLRRSITGNNNWLILKSKPLCELFWLKIDIEIFTNPIIKATHLGHGCDGS